MKLTYRDENDFPINFHPETFYRNKEEFKSINEAVSNSYPEYYLVSSWGRVLNTKTGLYIPRELTRDKNIYISAAIRDLYGIEIHIPMHRLVAAAFIPYVHVPGYDKILEVNHIDGVKWHNEPYNLEWVTNKENIRHANRTNLIQRPYGEDNGYSVLTDAQYERICELTAAGYWPYQINQIMNLGIDITNIAQKIRSGKAETIISQKYDFSNIKRNDYRKFSEDQVRYICSCLQDHPEMKPIEILRTMGYDVGNMIPADVKKLRDTISTIKRRVSYIEIGKDYNF